MGNRAILKFVDQPNQPKIYLHWNGGHASVQAFLNVAKARHLRTDDYGVARMCEIIGLYFGDILSLGCTNADFENWYLDNGVYIIKNFEIIGREYAPDEEEINQLKTDIITSDILFFYKKLEEAREQLKELKLNNK